MSDLSDQARRVVAAALRLSDDPAVQAEYVEQLVAEIERQDAAIAEQARRIKELEDERQAVLSMPRMVVNLPHMNDADFEKAKRQFWERHGNVGTDLDEIGNDE